MSAATPIGLVGVGLLGSAIAERLLRAGFEVVGHDLDGRRRAALAVLGGAAVESAGEVATADRLVLCLPDSDAVEYVLTGLAPHLRPGTLVIDTTTGDPDRTAATGEQLARAGIAYVDATVSGSSEQVRAGEVTVMAGGDPAAVARAADVLAAFARLVFHVGGCGAGARMKLVTNLVLGLNRAALAEGLAFARACGLDPAAALDVLRASAAYSAVMDAKGRKMVERDFAPQARLAQHLKDVRLILDQGRRTGAALPFSELHRALLEQLVAAGFGDADNAAVIAAFDQREPRTI